MHTLRVTNLVKNLGCLFDFPRLNPLDRHINSNKNHYFILLLNIFIVNTTFFVVIERVEIDSL